MRENFRQKRGFLLIFALLLTILITLIALGLLGLREGSYASSRAAINSIQARSLARSGMGDIWVKLSKDPFYPGGVGDDQTLFSFREDVTDQANNPVGSYQVILDRSHRLTNNVLRIECTGIAGQLDEKSSHFTIYAELSTLPGDFRFKVWQEGTSPKL